MDDEAYRIRLPDNLPAWFPEDLKPLLLREFAAFSPAEMDRRIAAIDKAMSDAEVDHLLICGANKSGTGPFYFTGWPTTSEAICVHSSGRRDKLWVQWVNHEGLARRMATRCDVAWGGPVNGRDSTLRNALDELVRRGAARGRVGLIGPLGWLQADLVTDRVGRPVNMNPVYNAMRLIKSGEELDWMRLGAAFCDASIAALLAGIKPGLTEHQLGAIVDNAYGGWGGLHGIHFLGVSAMDKPTSFVPTQFTTPRQVRQGDCVVTEISAAFWEYSGQVLRSFTVQAEPTPLYRDMHDAASAAFDAIFAVLKPGCGPLDIVTAAEVIEDAGFTICDDLVHGYGGGYLQPVLGSKSRPNGPLPDMVLRENMCLVIQPNVITRDHSAGLQTGECVVITKDGAKIPASGAPGVPARLASARDLKPAFCQA